MNLFNLISLDDVFVAEDRFRREFDTTYIEKLAGDIAEIGLIHLPILRGGRTLVSGEQRYRAIVLLSAKKIPFSYLGMAIPQGKMPYAAYEDLDETAAKEIELRENAVRRDLTWQEEALATAAMHKFRTKQDPNWTARDTQMEITGKETQLGSSNPVMTALRLAENLHRPELKNAKTKGEAARILRNVVEEDFKKELRSRAEKVTSIHTLIHGDALAEMPKLTADSFDCLVTDPPYGMDAHRFNIDKISTTRPHQYNDAWEYAAVLYKTLAVESFRFCKPQAHAYVFCAFEYFHIVAGFFTQAGWEVWPRPIIWYKHIGSLPKPELGPRYVYETILFANKGRRPVLGLRPDVIDISHLGEKRHAAEKPAELYSELLSRSILLNDKVIDPFAGCGPIFQRRTNLALSQLVSS